MITKDFKAEWIEELKKVWKQLQNVTVEIPSLDEQERAKEIIEQILPPEEGTVWMDYTRHILIALDYAEKHFRGADSMLDDIKAGRKLDISEYR